MKLYNVLTYVILLAIIAVLVWWIWRKPPTDPETEKRLSENIRLGRENDSLRAGYTLLLDLKRSDSVENVKAMQISDKNTTALQSEIVRLSSRPAVIQARRDIPAVDSVFVVYEKLDSSQGQEIDRLRGVIRSQDRVFNSVVANFSKRESNLTGINDNLKYVNQVLSSQNRNLRIQARVGLVVGAVGVGYGVLK
jgi:hypothetical protein